MECQRRFHIVGGQEPNVRWRCVRQLAADARISIEDNGARNGRSGWWAATSIQDAKNQPLTNDNICSLYQYVCVISGCLSLLPIDCFPQSRTYRRCKYEKAFRSSKSFIGIATIRPNKAWESDLQNRIALITCVAAWWAFKAPKIYWHTRTLIKTLTAGLSSALDPSHKICLSSFLSAGIDESWNWND